MSDGMTMMVAIGVSVDFLVDWEGAQWAVKDPLWYERASIKPGAPGDDEQERRRVKEQEEALMQETLCVAVR